MSLAIFDLDETILDIDSDHAWTEFLYEKKIETSPAFFEKMFEFKDQYIKGVLDIYEYISYCTKPFVHFTLSELQKLQEEFLEKKIKPSIRKKALHLIKEHKSKNDFFLIITATNQVVTEPIAKSLQADDLIATELKFQNGHYLPEIKGIPSFREGKVTRLKEWLEQNREHGLEGSFFYSDSYNDLPLLRWVANPVVVNGDARLVEYAQSNHWKQLNLKNENEPS